MKPIFIEVAAVYCHNIMVLLDEDIAFRCFQQKIFEFHVSLHKNFFSKGDQIHRKLRIWSHLLKCLMEKFFFVCNLCSEIFLVETIFSSIKDAT